MSLLPHLSATPTVPPTAPAAGVAPQSAAARWSFPESIRPALAGWIAMPDLRALRVSGADAATFLQGQLTQDVQALVSQRAQPAGWCTAKGRLLATFWVWRDDAAPAAAGEPVWWLVCASDLAEAVQRRLKMFVLRARVRIEHAVATVHGHLGDPADASAPPSGAPAASGVAVLARAQVDGQQALPMAGAWLEVRDASQAADAVATPAAAGVQAPPGDTAAPALWALAEILAGVPRVTASVQELFVPQMVNLDLIAGVNFRKGCYPGQEVVARSHYLGRLKRRMVLLTGSEAMPAPGADVFVTQLAAPNPANAADEPVGQVVSVAPLPPEWPGVATGAFVALASVQLDERADVLAGQQMFSLPATPARPGVPNLLALHELPYPIPEPRAPQAKV